MKKNRKSLVLRLSVFAFIIYIAVVLINLQLQISKDKATIVSVTTQYQAQIDKNAEIQRVLSENDDQYKESIARDKLGYARSDERIYVNVSGN